MQCDEFFTLWKRVVKLKRNKSLMAEVLMAVSYTYSSWSKKCTMYHVSSSIGFLSDIFRMSMDSTVEWVGISSSFIILSS